MRRKNEGGGGMEVDEPYDGPTWFDNCTTLVKVMHKNVYITCLPNQFNELLLTRQLQYYDRIGISTIISFEGCGVSNINLNYEYRSDHKSCNAILNEFSTIPKQQQHIEGNKWVQMGNTFYDIPILDMSAGTYNSWDNLLKLSKLTSNFSVNSTLIHCLAGKGRSGIAILLIILIDFPHLQELLSQKWLGLDSSYLFYSDLKKLFTNNLELFVDNNDDINFNINKTNIIEDIIEEVFNISSIYSIRLFTARINNILTMLGNLFGKTNIYLYNLPYSLNTTLHTLFDDGCTTFQSDISYDNPDEYYGISITDIDINRYLQNEDIIDSDI